MRTGAAYLDSLKDGRVVFLNGERVKSVPERPALRSAARSIADLYAWRRTRTAIR
jgi:4-hydroxyphenylacetate 3-monooxygenase